MCTNISLPTSNYGTVISARTMDFGKLLSTTVNFIPRGQPFPEIPIPGQLDWQNKYGFIGMGFTIYNLPTLTYTDGLNEMGLSAAALWLPESKYPKPQKGFPTLYSTSFVSYVLGNFQNVDEVKAALSTLTVTDIIEFQTSPEPPLHFIVSDVSGSHLVVEFINEKMKTYINDIGILTNGPTYDRHLKNLSNYKNLSLVNKPGHWYEQEANGSGQTGIPGDPTSSSRFIRAAFLRQSTFQPKNIQHGIGLALQILQTIAVPRGTIHKNDSKTEAGSTQWGIIRDHTNRSLYFYTNFNSTLYGIHLNKLNLNSSRQKQINVIQPVWYKDITEKFDTKWWY